MPGQLWAVAGEGGYLYSDELSDVLRTALQPASRFRQLCDPEDGTDKGLNRGDKFHWNVISDVATQGRKLAENQVMPETGFTLTQGELIITEYGNSVPYTGKLQLLAKQDIVNIIHKALVNDAKKAFDIAAWAEFDATAAHFVPAGGTSTSSITLTTTGTTVTTNNSPLLTGHIKAISDEMRERNVPPFIGDDYVMISHPSTFRSLKNELEDIHQYTDKGMGMIFNGEIGRYEGFRFIEQNHIPKGGAEDSTTFDPYTNTADAWNNALSSWAFALGADTVVEGSALPEEIRAKLPGDYGRSKGIAWYALEGFELVHTAPTQTRIFKWSSAA